MSLFIIDFLMKMAFNGLKPFTFQMLTRIEGFKVFFCLAVVIIFADLTFGLIYLSFSGLSVNETLIIEENIFNFLKVISSFYYAFCLHFAIPLPTTPFFLQIDESVKTSSSLQIIQFFHFCINKLIDLTILAYMAGSFVSAFGQRQEKKEKLEIND